MASHPVVQFRCTRRTVHDMNKIPTKMRLPGYFLTRLAVVCLASMPVFSVAQETLNSTWFVDDIPFVNVDDFMRRQSAALGLTESTAAYRILQERIDEFGMRHIRVQRTQEGYDVLGGDGWIHVRRDSRVLYGGAYVPRLEPLPPALVDIETAITTAVEAVPPRLGTNLELNDHAISQMATSLMVVQRDLNGSWEQDNIALAYVVDVAPLKGNLQQVYVDASDGSVFRTVPFPHCVQGTASTLYNGSKTINAAGGVGGGYILYDDCSPVLVHTTIDGSEVNTPSLAWTTTLQRTAASAHWAAGQTVDYFAVKHGRLGYDGVGGQYNVDILNYAAWDGAGMMFPNTAWLGQGGNGLSYGPWVSLDILGHEFSHALIKSEGALTCCVAAEHAAINESFGDIFGTMVESHGEPSTWNYYVGEDVWIEDGKIRDMSNPNAKLHPDTYHGTYWYTGSDVTDWVHINAGVQNYWFYLLSEGGSGTNDAGYSFNVSGIGKDKAARIAYETLVTYLWSTTGYSDMKNASIFRAIDLYGLCSNEVAQTINAWNAVGVSSEYATVIKGIGPLNCMALHQVHNALQPFTRFFINGMYVDCAISTNGTQVTLFAGDFVTLTPGFTSGDKFLAYIEPCLTPAKSRGLLSETTDQISASNRKPEDVRLFPNPTNAEVWLEWNVEIVEHTPSVLRVVDMNGRLVLEEQIRQGRNVRIDLSGEPQGTYIIEVRSEGRVYRERLILMY